MADERAYCGRHNYYGPWRATNARARSDLKRHLLAKHPRMTAHGIERALARMIPCSGIVGTFGPNRYNA